MMLFLKETIRKNLFGCIFYTISGAFSIYYMMNYCGTVYIDSFYLDYVTYDTERLAAVLIKKIVEPDTVVFEKKESVLITVNYVLALSDNINLYYIYVNENKSILPFHIMYFVENMGPVSNIEWGPGTAMSSIDRTSLPLHHHMVNSLLHPEIYRFVWHPIPFQGARMDGAVEVAFNMFYNVYYSINKFFSITQIDMFVEKFSFKNFDPDHLTPLQRKFCRR